MQVVVTGGAGFIGANLSHRLVGDERIAGVVVLDDLSTGARSNLDGAGVDFHEGSILDPDALDRAMQGADTVVHLAARPSVPRSIADPVRSHLVNATGTIEVLEAARRAEVRHVIVASSSSVYGANPILPKHEDLATLPLSPYAASKLTTESYALAYQHSFGLSVLAFRFFNVFGPLQPAGHAYAAVVPAFVDAALAGRPLPLHGDGKQSRDFTYVGTVTEILTDAVLNRVSDDRPMNLAFGTRTDLLDVVALLGGIIGSELAVEHLDSRPGDVRHSQADSSRLQERFPHVVPIPLEQGLRETVEWFRSNAAT
jgi:UDP-glucose 4-epimerase